MIFSKRIFLPLLLLGVWLGACYGVRFGLMENAHWVEVCDGKNVIAMCDLRVALGRIIYFRILPWAALACAVPAFFIRGIGGRKLAWLGLFITAPALVLYTVTPAVFSALIAALRLVRDERLNAATSNMEAPAQPSA
jgi:hypothetical protein